MTNLLKIVTRVAFFLSLALFGYVFFSQLTAFLSADIVEFDPRMHNPQYLRLLITAGFISAAAGILLESLQGREVKGHFFEENLKEKITLIISALFLSYFYTGTGQLTSVKNIVIFIISFLFFVYFLPKVVWFLTNSDIKLQYNHYSHRPLNRLTNVISKTILIIASILMVVGVSVVVFNIVTDYMSGKAKPDLTHRDELYIQTIEPKTASHTQNVTITGFNFGWKTDESYKLMSNSGDILQNEWTNEKIDFIIPLNMKAGDNEVWVVRPDSEPPYILEESNRVKIRVIDRFVFYPTENEPIWDRGLKRINRYIFFNIKIFNEYLY